MRLEAHLRERRDAGRKLLVPYVTGGLGSQWLEVVRAVASAGADAIEVGIPFSDPIMDGPTIQEASQRALDLGATPASVIAQLGEADVDVPVAVSANPSQAVTARRRLQVTIDVEIVQQANGRVLFQRKGMRGEGDYDERAEPEGRRKAIEKIVNDIVEGAQSQW